MRPDTRHCATGITQPLKLIEFRDQPRSRDCSMGNIKKKMVTCSTELGVASRRITLTIAIPYTRTCIGCGWTPNKRARARHVSLRLCRFQNHKTFLRSLTRILGFHFSKGRVMKLPKQSQVSFEILQLVSAVRTDTQAQEQLHFDLYLLTIYFLTS